MNIYRMSKQMFYAITHDDKGKKIMDDNQVIPYINRALGLKNKITAIEFF